MKRCDCIIIQKKVFSLIFHFILGIFKEESPIYLIDQSNVEKDHPPTIDMPLDSLTQDMRKEIEASISMKPSYQTLQSLYFLDNVHDGKTEQKRAHWVILLDTY